MRIILSFFVISVVFLNCFAQSNNKTLNPCEDNVINTKRPSAFITFERFGKKMIERLGDKNDFVWLRFHNNTKWKITIKTAGFDREHGDFGVFYEVQVQPLWKDKIKESDVPIGRRMAHVGSVRTIESGKSLLFSVPKEHLAEGLYIIVDFSYEWEQYGDSGGNVLDIIHQATFFSSNLPK